MSEAIKRTLERINNATNIPPGRVGVLVALPLNQKGHQVHVKTPEWRYRFGRKQPVDFIRSQTVLKDWTVYQKEIVGPLGGFFQNIRNNNPETVLRLHATYQDFQTALSGDQFECLFLLAHHITGKVPAIEFFDGGVPLKKVQDFINTQQATSLKACLLFICQSEEIGMKIWKDENLIGMVSTAAWDVPVIEGALFLSHWVIALNGTRSLIEAYHQALRDQFA